MVQWFMNIFRWNYWVASLSNTKFKFTSLADRFVLNVKSNYKTEIVEVIKWSFHMNLGNCFSQGQETQGKPLYFRLDVGILIPGPLYTLFLINTNSVALVKMVFLWRIDQVEVMKGFCGLYFLPSIFMASFEVLIDFD